MRRIDETEAAVVREVFEAVAAGDGYRTIAKRLNTRRIPSPSAGKRGTGSWSHTMVREVLLRERYIGTIVWGQAPKGYRGGTRVRLEADPSDQIRTERPELRIVPQDLWDQVHATMAKRAKPTTAGAHGPKPKHLVTA